jgi:hypothetical protein
MGPKRFLLIILGLALIAALGTGGWTYHSTDFEEASWSGCSFETFQIIPYDDHDSDSVKLEKAGQWVDPSGCDIEEAAGWVTYGSSQEACAPQPVGCLEYLSGAAVITDANNENGTLWWDYNDTTFSKNPMGGVISDVRAGDGEGSCCTRGLSRNGGWETIFWGGGTTIEDNFYQTLS